VRTAPPWKITTSVVPAPTSTSATPEVLLLDVSTRRRRDRAEHDVVDDEPACLQHLTEVLRRRHLRGHDVDLGLEPDAGDPDRLLQAFLVVDDVLLRST
jgi:hypothetical protein